MKIAIIGAGISGNMSAYLLNRSHDITVYEKANRPGGHSATVDIQYTEQGPEIAVDTGFIVYNEANYPGLTQLFDELQVETQSTDMSFCFSRNQGSLEWSGKNMRAIFAQKANILKPRFWKMLLEILRFNKLALKANETGSTEQLSLKEWLDQNAFNQNFRDTYLLPMAASIWSTPLDEVNNFPASSLIQFFCNHRLVNSDRPQWRTVQNGSREYVKKLIAGFEDRIRYASEITKVDRTEDGVFITNHGQTEHYDAVVFATHTNEALALLGDQATDDEKDCLGDIKYLPNQVYLHRDLRFMPKRPSVWSSWNYLSFVNGDDAYPVVSYWMNLLQNIPNETPLFVTLNPPFAPAPELTYGEYSYDHPQYNQDAIAAQQRIKSFQGLNRTWFCGAWMGYGFHEDGLQSALDVCRDFGIHWAYNDINILEAAE